MVFVYKKEGETSSALVYRFTKKMQQSGVLREAKKRRFFARAPGKLKRKLSALHRSAKRIDVERQKKLGIV